MEKCHNCDGSGWFVKTLPYRPPGRHIDTKAIPETTYYDPCRYCNPNGKAYSKVRSGCFISTAAVTAVSDKNGYNYLNKLRTFRDNVVSNSASGRIAIDRYYEVAPDIVDKINALDTMNVIYGEIYAWLHEINKHIDNGNISHAIDSYGNMVKCACDAVGVMPIFSNDDAISIKTELGIEKCEHSDDDICYKWLRYESA